jgi:hypothetical protein
MFKKPDGHYANPRPWSESSMTTNGRLATIEQPAVLPRERLT